MKRTVVRYKFKTYHLILPTLEENLNKLKTCGKINILAKKRDKILELISTIY